MPTFWPYIFPSPGLKHAYMKKLLQYCCLVYKNIVRVTFNNRRYKQIDNVSTRS